MKINKLLMLPVILLGLLATVFALNVTNVYAQETPPEPNIVLGPEFSFTIDASTGEITSYTTNYEQSVDSLYHDLKLFLETNISPLANRYQANPGLHFEGDFNAIMLYNESTYLDSHAVFEDDLVFRFGSTSSAHYYKILASGDLTHIELLDGLYESKTNYSFRFSGLDEIEQEPFIRYYLDDNRETLYLTQYYDPNHVMTSADLPLDPPDTDTHAFYRWNTGSSTGPQYIPGELTDNLELFASWVPVPTSHTIRVHENNFKASYTLSYPRNSIPSNNMPPTPVKNPTNNIEYVFEGWYVDEELTVPFDANEPITYNYHIYAKYTENSLYRVTFDSTGGSNVSYQTIRDGELASTPTEPTRRGYEFLGWHLEEQSYDFNTPVTENILLVATWNKLPVTYRVSFSTGYGASTIEPLEVSENAIISPPEEPTRPGYTFVEWQNHYKTYDFEQPITRDTTLTARWVLEGTIPIDREGDGNAVVTDTTTTVGKWLTGMIQWLSAVFTGITALFYIEGTGFTILGVLMLSGLAVGLIYFGIRFVTKLIKK